MKRIFLISLYLFALLSLSARTTYVVWQERPLTGSEEWMKTTYYIWEDTYTQRVVDDALQLTANNKGWIGGGYESASPFDNKILTDGYDLVFEIKTTVESELSVQLTSRNPEAAQSVRLSFDRDGDWHTIRLDLKNMFPKVNKAWSEGANGYVFSIIGGADVGKTISLRNIRYERSF